VQLIPVIEVGPVMSRLSCDRRVMHDVDHALAVESPGAFWAKRHRPMWDGMWHPLNMATGNFPTGLLPRVQKLVPLANVLDERKRPHTIPFIANVLQGIILADHQERGVKVILDEGRGIVALSVGSGKTEVGIAAAMHVSGLCVWLTHRRDLFHQSAERIKERAATVPAMIGDGCWDEIGPKTKFVVAMPQTVLQDLKFFVSQVEGAGMLVLDEAHRSSAAGEWYKVAQAIPAYYRVGLTGTPDIGDPVKERRLEATTGKILIRIRSSEMAKIGWVVPAEVIYHKVNNTPIHGADYMEARKLLIEENPERNAMVVELAMAAAKEGKRCLIICDTIRHARLIAEVLRGEDVRSRMLTGKNDSMQRIQAKKDLKVGALEVMVSTPIWDEGVDLPELDTVIIAAGGKSAARFIQRCGRALRKSPGKDKATIHDFIDSGSSYTMRHSVARMEACRKEGFEVIGAPQRLAAKKVIHEEGEVVDFNNE